MAKGVFKGSRGPARKTRSAIKQKCQFRKRRRAIDVKNMSSKLTLPKEEVLQAACRQLAAKCVTVKFCCQAHMDACKMKPAPAKARGGRASLDVSQIKSLFDVLLEDNCAWGAVLMLTQLFLGERADAARQCRWSWLKGLDPESLNRPTVSIPQVNQKTVAREIALFPPFGHLVWKWAKSTPLQGRSANQWPCDGQTLKDDAILFPGYSSDGQRRDFEKAISERAYLGRLRRAAAIIQQNRKGNPDHPFHEFDLGKLGTHSFKKSAVTLMCEAGVAFSVISKITGTSVKMLQATYDIATTARQSTGLKTAFQGLAQSIESDIGARKEPQKSFYCGWCGKKQMNSQYRFCTDCGEGL